MPTLRNQPFSFVSPGVSRPGFETFMLVKHLPDKATALLDMGCGSGYVAIQAALRGYEVSAADISPAACEITRNNAQAHDVPVQVFESNLFDQISGAFDVIAFNPPYGAPSSTQESGWLEWVKSLLPRNSGLCAAIAFWFIRKNRMQLIERFLHDAAQHLNSTGTVLLLLNKKEVSRVLGFYPGTVLDEARWMRLVAIPAASLKASYV